MWIKKMTIKYCMKSGLLKFRNRTGNNKSQINLFESLTETSKAISIKGTISASQEFLAVQVDSVPPNTKPVERVFNYLGIHKFASLSEDDNKRIWPLISKW